MKRKKQIDYMERERIAEARRKLYAEQAQQAAQAEPEIEPEPAGETQTAEQLPLEKVRKNGKWFLMRGEDVVAGPLKKSELDDKLAELS